MRVDGKLPRHASGSQGRVFSIAIVKIRKALDQLHTFNNRIAIAEVSADR